MTEVEIRGPGAPRTPARVAAFAVRLRRWTLRLASVAAVAAAVIVYTIVDDGYPSGGDAVVATIGIALAALPPVMLTAFWFALGELIALPERIRRLPFEGREHGQQLRAVLSDRHRRFAAPRALWRLTRIGASARETLTPYAPLLPFLSAPFLLGVALAALAALVEAAVACVLVVVLALD